MCFRSDYNIFFVLLKASGRSSACMRQSMVRTMWKLWLMSFYLFSCVSLSRCLRAWQQTVKVVDKNTIYLSHNGLALDLIMYWLGGNSDGRQNMYFILFLFEIGTLTDFPLCVFQAEDCGNAGVCVVYKNKWVRIEINGKKEEKSVANNGAFVKNSRAHTHTQRYKPEEKIHHPQRLDFQCRIKLLLFIADRFLFL